MHQTSICCEVHTGTCISRLIEEAFSDQERLVTYFGPTVGSHLGRGAVGVIWVPTFDN